MVALDTDSDSRDEHALRSCRLELAQVRSQQESLAEDLARERRWRRAERRRRRAAERNLKELSIAVDGKLSGDEQLTSKRKPSVKRFNLLKGAEKELTEQIELLQSSSLFRGAWYVRQYPAAVSSGMSPALHYLQVGAAKGYDPGPHFQSADYVRAHPQVAEAGLNPLVHHLRNRVSTRAEPNGTSALGSA